MRPGTSKAHQRAGPEPVVWGSGVGRGVTLSLSKVPWGLPASSVRWR